MRARIIRFGVVLRIPFRSHYDSRETIARFAQANAVAAVNSTGNVSAIMHPVGFMYRKDETVNVQANDMHRGNHKLDR